MRVRCRNLLVRTLKYELLSCYVLSLILGGLWFSIFEKNKKKGEPYYIYLSYIFLIFYSFGRQKKVEFFKGLQNKSLPRKTVHIKKKLCITRNKLCNIQENNLLSFLVIIVRIIKALKNNSLASDFFMPYAKITTQGVTSDDYYNRNEKIKSSVGKFLERIIRNEKVVELIL
ncbi:hypothetical protein JL36_10060 [Lactococcus cremoris]|nr:hypothetical protein JL36_10060 [Lactococcus cremoris]